MVSNNCPSFISTSSYEIHLQPSGKTGIVDIVVVVGVVVVAIGVVVVGVVVVANGVVVVVSGVVSSIGGSDVGSVQT